MCRCTNPHAESEAWFRVVHIGQFDHRGAAVAYYREQTVEIALGHKGAFENGSGSATSTTRSRCPCRRRGFSPDDGGKRLRLASLPFPQLRDLI